MAFRDTWHRALVYFGLAEDPEYAEGDIYEEGGTGEFYESQAPRAATVSRIGERRQRDEIDDIFADEEPMAHRTRVLRPVGGGNGGADTRVHLVTPYSFNDAQEVADKFKEAIPVILNLQT